MPGSELKGTEQFATKVTWEILAGRWIISTQLFIILVNMFFGKSQLHIHPLQTPAYLEFMCATYYLNPKNKIKAVKKN